MSFREPEQDEDPDWAYCPCGVCGVVQADHGHKFASYPDGYREAEFRICMACEEPHEDHPTHDWEPPTDNSPDEPEED